MNATNGAAYPAVKPVHFEVADILKPDDKVLEQFHSVADSIYRKKEALENQNQMNMQQSVFMLWGADRRPLEQFMVPDDYIVDENVQNSACGVIGKIQIKHEDKEKILRQLALCGINEKYIYPGIDGIGRYINKKYLFKSNNM